MNTGWNRRRLDASACFMTGGHIPGQIPLHIKRTPIPERIPQRYKKRRSVRRRLLLYSVSFGVSYHNAVRRGATLPYDGNRQPNYISAAFRKLLERNGLRSIRFHDLRHSCASMMLANGVAMKQIQEWLGHSDFSTTANIYAHLDYNSKLSSAEAMLAGLGLKCPEA